MEQILLNMVKQTPDLLPVDRRLTQQREGLLLSVQGFPLRRTADKTLKPKHGRVASALGDERDFVKKLCGIDHQRVGLQLDPGRLISLVNHQFTALIVLRSREKECARKITAQKPLTFAHHHVVRVRTIKHPLLISVH